jgi:hypothetical protein
MNFEEYAIAISGWLLAALFGYAYLKAQFMLDNYRTDSEILSKLRQRYDLEDIIDAS